MDTDLVQVTVEKIVPYLNMDRSDKQGDEECNAIYLFLGTNSAVVDVNSW